MSLSQGIRRDSIDLLSLPDPAKPLPLPGSTPYPNDSILKDPNNTIHTSSLEHSAFFNSPTPFGGSIVQELVLPDPVPSPRSTRKRQSSTSPIDGDAYEDEETAKKQRRLAKNREIAKNCRKRKKEKKAAILEEVAFTVFPDNQIQRLQEENEQLRQRLEDFNNESIENAHRNRVRYEFLQKMKSLIESKDETAITKEIEEYYSRWSEFGAERLSAAQIHLEQLKMLLLPTQVANDVDSHVDDKDVSVVAQSGRRVFRREVERNEIRRRHLEHIVFCFEGERVFLTSLQLTPEQKHKIISSRGGVLRQQNNIADVMEIVDAIQKKVTSNMESMQTQMRGILDVLRPYQQAKFLLWMEAGMNGTDLIAKLKKVLQMNATAVTDDSSSLSLSDMDSLSSLSMV